jgi:hypothetical protein
MRMKLGQPRRLRLSATCLFLALTFPVADAAAQSSPPSKEACDNAYEQGQRLRRSGQLIRARQKLLVCARAPCSAVFQPECLQWLAEADRLQPTVVIDVRSAGQPITDLEVKMDGQPLTEKLDGRELPVDPGEHVFRVESPGQRPVEKREVFIEGDKAHRLVLEIGAVTAAASPRDASGSKRSPWAAVVSSGVGALAVGSFAYFGLTGVARWNTLSACGLHCPASDITYTKTHFVVADVSLGVSLVAIGFATYFWITWAGVRKHETSSAARIVAPLGFAW